MSTATLEPGLRREVPEAEYHADRESLSVTGANLEESLFRLVAHERDTWVLSVSRYRGHRRIEREEWLNLAAAATPPWIMSAISQAQPVGPLAVHRFPANVRYRYDELETFP